MRNFKRKWTLDRTKYMTEPEVKELRRVVENKAQGGSGTRPHHLATLLDGPGPGGECRDEGVGNRHPSDREPLFKQQGSRMRVLGKGQKERDVFISNDLMRHLSDYLLWKRLLEEPMDPEAFVLVSSHRKPYATRTFNTLSRCVCERRGYRRTIPSTPAATVTAPSFTERPRT